MRTARLTARLRWGDNDRYFGPFTYAKDSKSYRPFAIELDSGEDEYPGCRLRLSALGHTLIIALPGIIQPERKKVVPTSWDAATIQRLGRNWYYDETRRVYGASYLDGHLSLKYGRQTHDSSTEQSKGWLVPWANWRFVRHSLYGLDGALHAHLPQGRWGSPAHDESERLTKDCPTVTFAFADYDGEQLTASTKIEEREWRFGTGGFAWLSLLCSPKVRRSLDIDFSGETGRRKRSWKGGTIGTGIEMLPGELHEAAFRRYCAEHAMVFSARKMEDEI